MNLVRKALRIGTLTWVALFLAVSGIKGMVLCIGVDGHISVEPSHQGSCAAEAGTTLPARPDTAAWDAGAADPGGECVDLSLSSDNLPQPASKVRPRQSASELSGFCAASLAQACFTPGPSAKPPRLRGSPILRVSSALRVLRTRVLLI